ncbi:MAG: hypothetical protein ABFD96_23720 [Armatimonadia bacterium]
MTPRDRMLRAIRFDSPDRPPLEIDDVPHLYDAYGTLDPAAARPGAMNGLRPASLRWHHPEYPDANVAAVGEAFRSLT